MIDIGEILEKIIHAVKGEEVRQAIHDAISYINDVYDSFIRGVTPVVTKTQTASGTKVDFSIGDVNTSFEVANGMATDAQVTAWLNAHPEATTTVQDGSLTEAKFSSALKSKAIKDYLTPEMYGAVGNGSTDDTNAFNSAIGYAETNKQKIVISPKQYKLTQRIFSDDSVVSENNGIYPNLPLIVSKRISDSPKKAELYKSLKILDLNSGGKWLNGACYDSKRDRVVMGFSDDGTSGGYLTAVSSDFETVISNTTVSANVHFNALAYDSVKDVIYTPNNGVVGGVFVIDPETLSISSNFTIPSVDTVIRSIAYDETNNIYYISNSNKVRAYDTDFNLITGLSIDYTIDDLSDYTGEPANSISRQSSTVIEGQMFELWHSGDKHYDGSVSTTRNVQEYWMTQFNYKDGDIKACYSFDSICGYDELECIVKVGDMYYLLGCLGTSTVYVSKVDFGKEIYKSFNTVFKDTNINVGTDLNDLITIGTYRCLSNSVANTLLNCPTNRAFRMEVLSNARGHYLTQVITTITGDVLYRYYDGSSRTWKDKGSVKFIKESGTNNGWHYEIYSDNTFEAWISTTVNPTSSTAVGSLYYSNQLSIPLPVPSVSSYSATANAGAMCCVVNPSISGTDFKFYLLRYADPSTQSNIAVRVIMKGVL